MEFSIYITVIQQCRTIPYSVRKTRSQIKTFEFSIQQVKQASWCYKMIRGTSKNKKKLQANSKGNVVEDKASVPVLTKTIPNNKKAKTQLKPLNRRSTTVAMPIAKTKPATAITAVESGGDSKELRVDNVMPEPKKMERSHSFFLTRQLSKIYNNITGSKESLTKIPENDEPSVAYKFSRSLTMAAIPIRQSFRRVFRESSRLEKLHEENVSDKADKEDETVETAEIMPTIPEPVVRRRPKSIATDVTSSPERRHSFLMALRRTFSNTHGEKDIALNPKWSASLANLQQIDVMVSYEDLSFINYDKFNTYEKQLAKLNAKNEPIHSWTDDSQYVPDVPMQEPISPVSPTVRMRKHPISITESTASTSKFASDFDVNFDQPRNLYRQSLDDKKLKFLNKVNRDSFRLSNNLERTAEDVLMLDNYRHNDDTAVDATVDTVDGVIVGRQQASVSESNVSSANDLPMQRSEGHQQHQSMCDLRSSSTSNIDDDSVSFNRIPFKFNYYTRQSNHINNATIIC